MKRISITWSETATYTQTFEVDDDFHPEGDDHAAAKELICESADLDKAFVSVDERDVNSIEVLT
ncbi:hypothetical protein QNA23_11020 [Rhodococcus erythropolis]|uniref:hypothetical protein n=1 Tax=Rhodococcus erythropolis TaxID=1833 RepID=UPI0024B9E4AF|nr:hypothetical protein [Rhodococcus erythropolis]MDJ0404014.1 hypothetical protein [Rhodococcus erythropolis]